MILIVPGDFILILIAVVAVALFVFIPVVIIYIPYVVHLQMADINGYYTLVEKVYSFGDFKEEFDRINWKEDPLHKGSLFADRDFSVYHVGIIKLNGAGVLMKNFVHYNLVKRYVKKYLKGELINERIHSSLYE